MIQFLSMCLFITIIGGLVYSVKIEKSYCIEYNHYLKLYYPKCDGSYIMKYNSDYLCMNTSYRCASFETETDARKFIDEFRKYLENKITIINYE